MTFGGIIKGGLLAGLLINVSEFVLNSFVVVPEGGAESSIAFWVVYAFVLGILVAYMYAVARPRWGAGPKSAVCAGIFVMGAARAAADGRTGEPRDGRVPDAGDGLDSRRVRARRPDRRETPHRGVGSRR